MPTPPTVKPRPASAALTTASGYLAGFTHTLQPYIGCAFGCSYCYVQGLPLHRCHRPPQPWGDYVHPRTGIAAKLAGELRKLEPRQAGDNRHLHVERHRSLPTGRAHMAPEPGLSRHPRRAPAGLLVIRTRSPLAEDDFDRMAAFGARLWLNLTIETDRDDIRRRFTPALCVAGPPLADGGRHRRGPASAVDREPLSALFNGRALWRVAARPWRPGHRGQLCQRRRQQRPAHTAGTTAPKLFAPDETEWQDETTTRALYAWLRARTGEKAGWSQASHSALPAGFLLKTGEYLTRSHGKPRRRGISFFALFAASREIFRHVFPTKVKATCENVPLSAKRLLVSWEHRFTLDAAVQ